MNVLYLGRIWQRFAFQTRKGHIRWGNGCVELEDPNTAKTNERGWEQVHGPETTIEAAQRRPEEGGWPQTKDARRLREDQLQDRRTTENEWI